MSIYWALALWASGFIAGFLLGGMVVVNVEPPNPRTTRPGD